MLSTLNIKRILTKYRSIEIELLLAFVLKKPKEFLFMNGENRLTRIQSDKLTRMVRRREKGEPIAYILGYKDFYGLRFKVNKNVLVPRPETEYLIERLKSVIPELRVQPSNIRDPELSAGYKIDKYPNAGSRLGGRDDKLIKILDVGTGSGCIAITLAKQFKDLKIVGSDISTKALTIAKQNAKKHKVKIKFIHSDILQNVRMTFDVLVANLPYVPRKYYESRIKNLGWEPKIALIDQKKDFDVYGRLFQQVATLPALPKKIFLEIDPSQKKLLPKQIKKHLPKANVKFYKDFNNLWRFVEITI